MSIVIAAIYAAWLARANPESRPIEAILHKPGSSPWPFQAELDGHVARNAKVHGTGSASASTTCSGAGKLGDNALCNVSMSE
jgi:hypothetical protein